MANPPQAPQVLVIFSTFHSAMHIIGLLFSSVATATLESAFRAWGECEVDGTIHQRLEKRLAFFAGVRSEEEVRNLPEHTALNEQEAVLALQDVLLRPGKFCRLDGLEQYNGCLGTLVACLRDGSFRCVVELDRGFAGCDDAALQGVQSDEPALTARVSVAHLRPAGRCAVRELDACSDTDADGPEEFNDGEATKANLDAAAVGQMMTDAVMAFQRLSKGNELLAGAESLGATTMPDLPYAALVLVLAKMREAGCQALRAGDLVGARLALTHALELEEASRAEQVERSELHISVRSELAALLALESSLHSTQRDPAAARAAAFEAQRLNITSSISSRKLVHSLKRAQLASPHAVPGMLRSKREVKHLQRWFAELVTLEDGPGHGHGQGQAQGRGRARGATMRGARAHDEI